MFNITLFKDTRWIFNFIMFNDSFIESVIKTIRLPCGYIDGFVDLTVYNVQSAFLSFWSVYNENVAFIHSFIHSHFVRILHRQRASKINCRIEVFSLFLFFFGLDCFIINNHYYLFLYRNLSLTAVATPCMPTWATYQTTKTGRFTEHVLQIDVKITNNVKHKVH